MSQALRKHCLLTEGTTLEVTVEGKDINGLQKKLKRLVNCCHRFGCSNVCFWARKYFSNWNIKLHYLLPPGWCWQEECHFPFCKMKWAEEKGDANRDNSLKQVPALQKASSKQTLPRYLQAIFSCCFTGPARNERTGKEIWLHPSCLTRHINGLISEQSKNFLI